jgi:acyl carrier protein
MKLTRYIQIIEEQLDVVGVRALASFKDDFGADSLDMVELIVALEDELGVDLPDSCLEQDCVGLLFAEVLQELNLRRLARSVK